MEVKEKFLKMEPQMPIKSSDKLDEVEDLIYYNEEEDEDQVEESDGNDEIQEDNEVNEPFSVWVIGKPVVLVCKCHS